MYSKVYVNPFALLTGLGGGVTLAGSARNAGQKTKKKKKKATDIQSTGQEMKNKR